MRYDRLDDKTKKICGLFYKFSVSVVGSCEVKKPHIFITIANQHIQKINRQFDGTLNHFCLMVFELYRFKDMLLQPDK